MKLLSGCFVDDVCDTSVACAVGFCRLAPVGVTGVCVTYGCSSDDECAPGSTCFFNIFCGNDIGNCTAPGGVDADCGFVRDFCLSTLPCAEGLSCVTYTGLDAARCEPPTGRVFGAPCIDGAECLSGSCEGTQCTSCIVDADCGRPGLVCYDDAACAQATCLSPGTQNVDCFDGVDIALGCTHAPRPCIAGLSCVAFRNDPNDG